MTSIEIPEPCRESDIIVYFSSDAEQMARESDVLCTSIDGKIAKKYDKVSPHFSPLTVAKDMSPVVVDT
jgi:hypothetical protein